VRLDARAVRSMLFTLLIALSSACGALPPPEAEIAGDPIGELIAEPDGPVVLLESGSAAHREWAMYAFRRGVELCFSGPDTTGPTGGCSPRADELGGFGITATALGGTPSIMYGALSPAVAQVRVEMRNGTVVDATVASLRQAGVEESAFVAVFGPEDVPVQAVAFDRDGNQLDAVEFER
jgi:hypothetical protein